MRARKVHKKMKARKAGKKWRNVKILRDVKKARKGQRHEGTQARKAREHIGT